MDRESDDPLMAAFERVVETQRARLAFEKWVVTAFFAGMACGFLFGLLFGAA